MLAVGDVGGGKWSNWWDGNIRVSLSILFGAGVWIVRPVGTAYAQAVKTTPLRQLLSRRPQSLVSGEDVDMALFACKCGLGMGNFSDLSLTHLIPSRRLTERYILEIAEGHSLSYTILAKVW